MKKPRQRERHVESGDQDRPGRVWEVIAVGSVGALSARRGPAPGKWQDQLTGGMPREIQTLAQGQWGGSEGSDSIDL